MEFADVVRSRRMVRTYDPDRPVPQEALLRALEHARRAPSAGHTQGWDFLVLARPGDRARFWAAAAAPGTPADEPAGAAPTAPEDPWLRGLRTAPVLVVVLSAPQRYLDRYAEPDKGWTDRDPDRWPVPYWDVDAGMAALLILLTAVDEQLAGCFFGVPGPAHPAVLEAFGVPGGRRIVGVVSLGHPAATDRRSPSLTRGRRSLGEIVHDGRFGRPWPSGQRSAAEPGGGQQPAQPAHGRVQCHGAAGQL